MLPSVCKLLFLKEYLLRSRRFMLHTSVKYRDYKVWQRRITKCDRFKNCKVRQSWITNYDRFWITKYEKNFKNWITKCNGITKRDKFGSQIVMGLQNPIDYKVIQYMCCMKTTFFKKRFDITANINKDGEKN